MAFRVIVFFVVVFFSIFFTVININLITTTSYKYQLRIQRCVSFNMVHHPRVSPCKITSSKVLKLQGLTKRRCSAGSQK